MTNTFALDWNVDEKMPRYDDLREFEVWIRGSVRRVRRIGNRSCALEPGTLAYTDCTHPMQNIICDERAVQGWRYFKEHSTSESQSA